MSGRHREKYALTTINCWQDTTCMSCAARGKVQSLLQPAAIVGRYESMDDIVTLGFNRRSGNGEMIVSPMTRYSEEHSATGDFSQMRSVANGCNTAPTCKTVYDYRGPWAHYLVAGSPAGGSKPTPIPVLSDADKASARLAAATSAWAGTSEHSADVLTDLAEISQTLRMLRDPLQSGHKFLNKVAEKSSLGSYGSLRHGQNYAYSMWLQYRYGIRPLVKSISGILKEIGKTQRPLRHTSRGQYSIFGSSVAVGTRVGAQTTYGYSFNYGESYEVRCGVVIDEVISLAQALGCDASGMLALPWELVPYSFVADWFANVGTFIKAIVPFLSKRPIAAWTVSKTIQTVTFQVTSCSATAPLTATMDRGANELRSSTYITTVREPVIRGPSIVLKPQSLGAVLTDARAIDSLALFVTKMDRLFKH